MSHQATSWAFQLRGLKPSAKLVLLALADCHNPAQGCYPSQAFLADACELNRDTVNVHLAALEAAGLIRRIRSVHPKTKRQQSTRYKLAFEADFDTPEPAPEEPAPKAARRPAKADSEAKAVSEFPAEPCRNFRQSRVGISDTNLVKEPVMEPVVQSGAVAPEKIDFEAFWKAHPRPKDREACEALFAEAVASGVSPGWIVNAAERYRAENKGNKPFYLARSDNWLKAKRWTEYPAEVQAPSRLDQVEATAAFLAGKIKAGSFVHPSGVSPVLAAIMVQRSMVTPDQLRKIGVQV